MSSRLQTLTNLSPEHPYENIFTHPVRADLLCLYSYHSPVVAKGKSKRFSHSECELVCFFLGVK